MRRPRVRTGQPVPLRRGREGRPRLRASLSPRSLPSHERGEGWGRARGRKTVREGTERPSGGGRQSKAQIQRKGVQRKKEREGESEGGGVPYLADHTRLLQHCGQEPGSFRHSPSVFPSVQTPSLRSVNINSVHSLPYFFYKDALTMAKGVSASSMNCCGRGESGTLCGPPVEPSSPLPSPPPPGRPLPSALPSL